MVAGFPVVLDGLIPTAGETALNALMVHGVRIGVWFFAFFVFFARKNRALFAVVLFSLTFF